MGKTICYNAPMSRKDFLKLLGKAIKPSAKGSGKADRPSGDYTETRPRPRKTAGVSGKRNGAR